MMDEDIDEIAHLHAGGRSDRYSGRISKRSIVRRICSAAKIGNCRKAGMRGGNAHHQEKQHPHRNAARQSAPLAHEIPQGNPILVIHSVEHPMQGLTLGAKIAPQPESKSSLATLNFLAY